MLRGVGKRVVLCLLCLPPVLPAYSVLTHEAVIDSAWLHSIRPLLQRRFPDATAAQLLDAHAYAYGGAIIQDLGYYPFGSKFFSALVHYVRSGDFVCELLRDARDLDEYAFALGALAHYTSDTTGHPMAVNLSVPQEYPRMEKFYGPVMTYEDDPVAHLKVEFGFDVLEVAQNRYAPKAYHDFIGFKVSKNLLERAFRRTYGLKLSDVFFSVDLTLGTYRRTVSTLIPEATKVAWRLKKDEIRTAWPGITKRRFLYNLSRASYEREWGREYNRPGPFAKVLAFLFRLIPKVGPFRGIAFEPPTPKTARLFMHSFNVTLSRYRERLRALEAGGLSLPNVNLDSGVPTAEGRYRLADEAYAKLARTLAEQRFAGLTSPLRQALLAFFDRPGPPDDLRSHPRRWLDTARALAELRAAPAVSLNQDSGGE